MLDLRAWGFSARLCAVVPPALTQEGSEVSRAFNCLCSGRLSGGRLCSLSAVWDEPGRSVVEESAVRLGRQPADARQTCLARSVPSA